MSKFKVSFSTENYDCPWSQILTSKSGREMNIKLRLHSKFCSKVLDTASADPNGGYNKPRVVRRNYVEASRKANRIFNTKCNCCNK